ncbi:DNA/RNA non-specific endonuclease [Listeria grayi]|uniref:DNA/RNA non-specific endonuclease n=1 Tax=Listeria grayi TaxID=1641 RepID=UPI00162A8FDD|nr:DNA/RNA non-specific endonuclease [Listeria grayi]MBC1920796.1 DNA/RNA non-specific endonuclease [Listeria grayi]
MKRKSPWISLIIIAIIAISAIFKIDILGELGLSDQPQKQKQTITRSNNAPLSNAVDQTVYKKLASKNYQSGEAPYIEVNNGQSNLDIRKWKENRVIYGNLDKWNRTTYVTAFIDRKNLGKSKGRDRQIWQPTGWHQKEIGGMPIYNRGHLLAYTSSFNFDQDGNYKTGEQGSIDNPKNLATQSQFSNQHTQTYFENKVRNAQAIRGNKVIYQIVTVFRGQEKMPRGYWLQAVDSKGTLHFNVYNWNVQPGIVFNYATGTSKVAKQMKVSTDNHLAE